MKKLIYYFLSSNTPPGVKKQAEGGVIPMYGLINVNGRHMQYVPDRQTLQINMHPSLFCPGGGYLMEIIKKCVLKKNYRELEEALDVKMKPFLYNEGRGKFIPIAQLVYMRNLDR